MRTRVLGPPMAANAEGKLTARPNIFFVLTDDQSRQTLDCYGGKQVATQHLDAMAHDAN
jgi:arylsulfatase A-like enzyme